MIGMDAEWGLYQRIAAAHKFPWAMTLGAIQDKSLIEKNVG
jgi:beta-glucosidase-like glycosyl hydrolase